MSWIEEESKIKFVDWGKLKPEHTEDDAIVIGMGETKEAVIMKISQVEKTNKDNEIVFDYKYRLKFKDEDKEVLMWSNSAIKRQQESLDLKEGEQIQITYVKDYKTSFGQKGRDIKIAVNRNGKKPKK